MRLGGSWCRVHSVSWLLSLSLSAGSENLDEAFRFTCFARQSAAPSFWIGITALQYGGGLSLPVGRLGSPLDTE